MMLGLIQARMGSSRLPGKVMMPIEGEPLIWHVTERLRRAHSCERVAVATGARENNVELGRFLEERGVPVFYGKDDDVLGRYVAAARHFSADAVMRVTADCPLIDPAVAEQVATLFRTTGCDYASNVHEPTFPDGLDIEVMTLKALERAHEEAFLPSEREHVTPYLWKHPELFRLQNLEGAVDLGTMRWIVDDARDLEFVRQVYRNLHPRKKDFGMEDILDLLGARPELGQINNGTQRNEGYARSLRRDAASGS